MKEIEVPMHHVRVADIARAGCRAFDSVSSGIVAVPRGNVATGNADACRLKRQRWRKKSHRCRLATLAERRKAARMPLQAAALPSEAAPSRLPTRMHAA